MRNHFGHSRLVDEPDIQPRGSHLCVEVNLSRFQSRNAQVGKKLTFWTGFRRIHANNRSISYEIHTNPYKSIQMFRIEQWIVNSHKFL